MRPEHQNRILYEDYNKKFEIIASKSTRALSALGNHYMPVATFK